MSQNYRRRPAAGVTVPIEIRNVNKLVADRSVVSSLPHRPSYPQFQQLDMSLTGRTASASSNSTEVISAARAARGRAVAVKASVGRSHSHVTARQTNRGNGKNAASGKPRYSCDVPRSRHESGESASTSTAQLTLVLLGAPRVGKTALVNQFLWEAFIRDYHPTVEEFNWIEYECSSSSSAGKKAGGMASPSHDPPPSSSILLQIIDSSGSRDFLAMRHLYCKIGNAFMIVYALNDKTSYAEALLMLKEIEERNPDKNVPILLVANKCDLMPNSKSALPTGMDEEEIASQAATYLSNQNVETVKQAFSLIIGEMARERKILMQGVADPFINPNLALHLQKRRQSMPSRRTANDLGIDEDTLIKLMRKHDSHRSNCTIS